MLKIMSKTDNSQTAFGQGQTSGYVNDASQNYGHLATGTLKDKGQFFGYNDTTHEVKVFYMEKPWGNRWDRINGLLMVGGEILAKMTPPYNLTGKDFEKVGITFTSSGNGYQKGTVAPLVGAWIEIQRFELQRAVIVAALHVLGEVFTVILSVALHY